MLLPIVMLGLAMGGVSAGLGLRAAMRVRALAASALLLMGVGYGVLLLAGRLANGSFARGLSFLALWSGVVLGALVAVIACAAGLTHAAHARHQRWLAVLLVGSLMPLMLCVGLVNAIRTAYPDALAQDPQRELAMLIVALSLAALAPLAPLIYGAWATHHEAEPPLTALAMQDSLDGY